MWNSLTTLKLALQLLERRSMLPESDRRTVQLALRATDSLAGALTRQQAVPARERSTFPAQVGMPASARQTPSASLPALLWRFAWPLGKRVLVGVARYSLTPRVVGLRARGGRQPAPTVKSRQR